MRNLCFPGVMTSHCAHNVKCCMADTREKLVKTLLPKGEGEGEGFSATTPEPLPRNHKLFDFLFTLFGHIVMKLRGGGYCSHFANTRYRENGRE